jgi:hypothetical protein
LEDRKELLLCLAAMLAGELVLSKIAVARWCSVTTTAAFFILSRAEPKMPLRTLNNSAGEFLIRDAAEVLATAATGLVATEDENKAMVKFLFDNCWGGNPDIVDAAIALGFDPQQPEEKNSGDGGKGQGGPRLAVTRLAASSPRTLRRSGTDEEIDALDRQNRLIKLKLAVLAGEAQMLAASTPTKATSTNTRAQLEAEVQRTHAGSGPRILGCDIAI